MKVKSVAPAVQPTPTVSLPSTSLRWFLYLTAAVTGAAVMIVEILGAKMLSPYVGMSHFVWTAQIAVTLIALACGYYVGGRMADKSQQLDRLYWALLAAGIYLALTVLLVEPVAYRCLDLDLAVGSLLASAFLFFIPLACLAMTGPFLVQVLTGSVSGVGGNVGRLISISTIGSFVGTMLIGYVMIPFLPNAVTMFVTSVALILVCAAYFIVVRRKPVLPLLLALAAIAPVALNIRKAVFKDYKTMVELYHGNSNFGQLQVVETRDGSCRYYLNDFLTQNTYDPERKQSMSHFTYMLSGLARCYTSNINDVLCIGLGVGIVPMDFAASGTRVDVVEINPAVIPVGRNFFGLDTGRMRITVDDGRHYLNRCRKQYDAVILDAFLGDSSPSHLLSREAFTAVRRVLRPGGALVINAFGELETGRDFFAASVHKTLKSVFPGVRIHASGDGGLFFVATDHAEPEFVHRPDLANVHPVAVEETRTAYYGIVDTTPEHGMVLTDNYNPAEFYDARNREAVRRRLAWSAKEM